MRIDLFCAHLADEQCAPNTITAYRADLLHFSSWFEAENAHECDDRLITPTDLRLYRDNMIAANAAPSTVNRRLACLRRYLGWAVAVKRLEQAPKAPKSLTCAKEAPKALDKNAEFALFRAVERSGRLRDIAIFKLLFNSALRVGEAANLRLEDINLGAKTGSVHVRHAKGAKTRVVPLNSEARAALRAYLVTRPVVGHDFVFVGQRRQPLGVRGVEALFGKYSHIARLKNVTPHTARHTVLSRLMRSGADSVLTASIAGHTSLAMLMRYTQPSALDKATALERLS